MSTMSTYRPWPTYPTGGGYWCNGCGRWVGNFEYHACNQFAPKFVPAVPTTTIINRSASATDERLKFALELVAEADDIEAARKIARQALGREADASAEDGR